VVGQQRRDVLEHHAGRREVRDVDDPRGQQGRQVDRRHAEGRSSAGGGRVAVVLLGGLVEHPHDRLRQEGRVHPGRDLQDGGVVLQGDRRGRAAPPS
jgi:hypothetical protein